MLRSIPPTSSFPFWALAQADSQAKHAKEHTTFYFTNLRVSFACVECMSSLILCGASLVADFGATAGQLLASVVWTLEFIPRKGTVLTTAHFTQTISKEQGTLILNFALG